MSNPKRKGARSIAEIPADILQQLNEGNLETANLVEWLAVDQRLLLKNILTQENREKYLKTALFTIENLEKQTVNTVNEAIGHTLFLQAQQADDVVFLNKLRHHNCDIVRCWATFTVGKNTDLSLEQLFVQIEHFAADSHFGVRELAWLAIRQTIIDNLDKSIEILSKWALSENDYIRRFASESTRPRGVWCKHIDILKQNPEKGLPILEPLKADSAKYVQDSVGNWLNDASKTQPDFVWAICEKWQKESPSKATNYILNKALRTLEKKN